MAEIRCSYNDHMVDEESFSFRHRRGKIERYPYCNECKKLYQRRYYERNKVIFRDQAEFSRRRNKQFVTELKNGLVCCVCGETHPACLQFHHRDPSEKVANISDAINQGWSIERIKSEIEKCDIVCANCHGKIHWN